jgi:hypothetical protein
MLASAADSSTISSVKTVAKKVVPMIHVPDVRATVAWYEKIGFTVKATYPDETGDNFSFAILSFGEANNQVKGLLLIHDGHRIDLIRG